MKFDNKNNIIEVCQFESFLAKYFVENPQHFAPLITKILDKLEFIISINSDTENFDRELFSIFSILALTDSSIQDLNALRRSSSIIAFSSFLKYFTENIMSLLDIKLSKQSNKEQAKTAALPKSLFFNQPKPTLLELRPDAFFSEENRGVTELDEDNPQIAVRHLGILAPQDTPEELQNYFMKPHEPSYQFYAPKENANMAIWLRQRYLPVITGASGGIGKMVCQLTRLMSFNLEEYQLLGILVAASTIAHGHHSFFEVIKPLSSISEPLQDTDNLFDFYQQTIPLSIRKSVTYQQYAASQHGKSLIIELADKNYQPQQDQNRHNQSNTLCL